MLNSNLEVNEFWTKFWKNPCFFSIRPRMKSNWVKTGNKWERLKKDYWPFQESCFFHRWTNSPWMRPVVIKLYSPKQKNLYNLETLLETHSQALGPHKSGKNGSRHKDLFEQIGWFCSKLENHWARRNIDEKTWGHLYFSLHKRESRSYKHFQSLKWNIGNLKEKHMHVHTHTHTYIHKNKNFKIKMLISKEQWWKSNSPVKCVTKKKI